ncbi:hypothetical protein ScPMuIL_004025 [Solemya velum]
MHVVCGVSILATIVALFPSGYAIETNYRIGAGIADITGPAAEVNMMGYANPSQVSNGIHFRQYSRAFIVSDSAGQKPVVFVSVDACMLSQVIKLEVVKKLAAMYGDIYTEKNLCISGIHTHSTPGGFHQYILYDITSLGFVEETYEALVNGIVKSIQRAHDSIRPGNIFINEGELLGSNINRSPTAYANNPVDEKARYRYNVDKNMTVLKFVDANNQGIGMINWFAVHCTSMNNTNGLISGDNKGYASYLFEKSMNSTSLPGQGKFVAAFAQSNEGDVSPNTAGPRCLDTGLPCDTATSTCNGRNELCVAFGPGKDMVDSTRIIGENQFRRALELFNAASTMVTGPVDFRHTYVDMSQVKVHQQNTTVQTCKPAMGYSFAAGTTDGPGMFDFKQGANSSNFFWNLIRDFLKDPSKAQIDCHRPKPILIDVGEMTRPYAWAPDIVDTQIFRIGQLVIITVPAEFTTMSGRRTRDAVTNALKASGFPSNTVSVIAGLSNDYADYVTTYEEYQVQRYEGASTIYGPHTLEAYIQKFVMLAEALAKGENVSAGPPPPNLYSKQLSFLPPVIFDLPPLGKHFGEVIQDAEQQYRQGTTVEVKFVGANPRNNVKAEGTFLKVEQLQSNQQWAVKYTDSSWETRFHWKQTNMILGHSEVGITWDVPANQEEGTYRIQYLGDWKRIDRLITPFTGTSRNFTIVSAEAIPH